MRFSKIFVLVFLSALVFASGSAVGEGKGMSKILVNYDGIQFSNPCTGEMIELFGENMIVFRLEYDANGSEHMVYRWKMHTMGAIGLSSGTIYKAVGLNYGEKSYITPDFTGNYYMSSHFGYISRNSLPNWFQKEHFKIVINAKGDWVIEDILPREIECRGKQ